MAATKEASLSFTETVEVLVGAEKTKFVIHPHIICRRSPYFEAAIARWKKDGEPVVLGEDTTPEVFDFYLKCVYSKEMRWPVYQTLARCFELLGGLYVLSEKLGDLSTANEAADRIIRLSQMAWDCPTPSTCHKLWVATSETSPLRRLLVDCYVHQKKVKDYKEDVPQLLGDMVREIAITLRSLVDEQGSIGKSPMNKPKCHYHQHSDAHPECEGVTK